MPRKSTKLTPGRGKLSIREKVFVSAIASDPSKVTFANGVRSALAATSGNVGAPHGSLEYNSANQLSLGLLKKDSVKSAIDKTLTAHKLTVADRAAALADILHAKDHITVHTTTDKDGIVSSIQNIVSSNASDRIKTVDILNKMDGTYTSAADASHMHAKVLSTMLDEYSRKMRSVLQNAHTEARSDAYTDTVASVQIEDPEAVVGQDEGIVGNLEGSTEPEVPEERGGG